MQQTKAAQAELQEEADAANKDINAYKAENASKEKEQDQIMAEIKRQQALATKQNNSQTTTVTKQIGRASCRERV